MNGMGPLSSINSVFQHNKISPLKAGKYGAAVGVGIVGTRMLYNNYNDRGFVGGTRQLAGVAMGGVAAAGMISYGMDTKFGFLGGKTGTSFLGNRLRDVRKRLDLNPRQVSSLGGKSMLEKMRNAVIGGTPYASGPTRVFTAGPSTVYGDMAHSAATMRTARRGAGVASLLMKKGMRALRKTGLHGGSGAAMVAGSAAALAWLLMD